LARRYYSRAWQGDLSRHQWRIKRMKRTPRLTKHKSGICPQNPF
jgi:hypothetical protein